MSSQGFDYRSVSPDGRTVLIVEAKARRAMRFHDANQWRRRLMTTAPELNDRPALLISPDVLYYWPPHWDPTNGAGLGTVTGPDLGPRLSRYLSATADAGAYVDPHVFEAVVGNWLEEVQAGRTGLEFMGDRGSEIEKIIRGGKLERTEHAGA